MSVTSWFLVSSSGTRHRLPREMIFVGREDCELMLQSRSVDKQHAVINYNPATDEHLVKDLGSLNGTFVNDLRIPDQTYITLKLSDIVRFGYDSHVYILERSQHKVPEEALKHEKYTSQLQMGIKCEEGKQQNVQEEKSKLERSDRKSLTESPVPRPTPLYGQPSWWGEEDSGNMENSEVRRSSDNHSDITKEIHTAEDDFNLQEIHDGQAKSTYLYNREPSYFEIPTKEFHVQHKSPTTDLIDIPTKDTNVSLISTPPVVQSHASFTIEFDDCMPGKIKIKDHVTKFSSRQRSKQQQPGNTLAATPTEVLSAESKVADWLVQSDVSMMCRRTPCEDVYSTKSDLAMHIRTLKGHHHDDGTQSDSEDPVMKGKCSKSHHSMQSVQSYHSTQSKTSEPSESLLSQQSVIPQKSHNPQTLPQHKHHQVKLDESEDRPIQEGSSPPRTEVEPSHTEPHTQQAFIIEFFDDNPRKKRSQSFTHNSVHADSYSALKAKLERRKGLAHGERPASVHGLVPPTQQITVPLKGASHGGSQRSSSLKREKTEDTGSSSSLLGSSSRSSPTITIKPFGSMGKNSKLAQEFTEEFSKDTGKIFLPPKSAPPVMMSPSHTPSSSLAETSGHVSVSYPSSPCQHSALPQSLLSASSPVSAPSHIPGRSPVFSASPVCSSVPQVSPQVVSCVDTKASRVTRTEEEDSLSDAGTYTIETESQDKEVEEARSMIDQVFGVLDAPEYSGQTLGVYRPVIDDGDNEQLFFSQSHSNAADVMSTSSLGHGRDQVISLQAHPGVVGPKWVSRWASLADPYSDPGATQGSVPVPPQSAERDDRVTLIIGQCLDISESEGSQSSRTRRLLPQVPPGEKLENTTPSILIRHETNLDHEPPEKGSRMPQQQDNTQRLRVQDDVDPDSLSDTSRSDDSSILDRSGRSQGKRGTTRHLPSENVNHSRELREMPQPTPKPTSFYIGSEDGLSKSDVSKSPVLSQPEKDSAFKIPPTTVLIRHLSGHESRRPVKPNSSAPDLQTHNKDVVPTKDTSTSFVRQESFTKDRPSDNIQVKKLPHISSHPALRSLDTEETLQDTFTFLKEVEKSPEEKLSGCSQRSKKGSSPAQEDSFSGDSDVDTASTVSMVSSKNAPVSSLKKHTSANDTGKEKSSSGLPAKHKARQPTARERLSEKRKSHASADNTSKAELSRRLQLRRSAGNRGSLDLSDNQHGQQLWPEAGASDHESSSRPNNRKKLTAPLQKEDPNKVTKGSHQVLTRSNSLSAPRPTRASMLRRARLGEASDNESAETDRASPSSEHSKTESKKLSRLDILAMPRKRTRSFTVPSDNESTSSKHGISNRTTEASSSARKGASSEVRHANSKGTAAAGKHSSRTHSTQVKHSSTAGSHRRQRDSDYSSTSEEEFETKTNCKQKRSHASASTQTQTPQKTAQMRLKCGSLETEEDETQNEHFQNWSTHSAEIARLSQDLAKDLAILAREIHDVAGDGDSQASSGIGATTSPVSMPNTPASTISTREERPYASLQSFLLPQLVQHIPEASLNYQKVPPGSTSPIDQDSNMNDHDSSRRRPWNREEVILDNLMLNPVSQLSQAIRENTEQLAEKMKVLFHNKTEVWEEIEAKINAENEVPIIKTSNKEISSILQELRRVQRQLEVINTIVEPGGILKMPPKVTSGGKIKSAPKEFTSSSSTNANASAKQGPRGSGGGRYV
ncbi:centrosomal protein of 170 kDa protein B isoform X1 [Danio rerio]|uniref:Centrosomal protein of 170 kDa protein B isoform X1 n=1 Tax=Danio rerio TaxID=7955 RepID=A0A8M2B758_DANRE|nr:centrosomal protein of 170 kDa protein B isoform X1 [Danio rerio]|eukprot:XP_005160385.1 centrosomal protein of 170 kDa protein B isoform X1 [Danio rerio]